MMKQKFFAFRSRKLLKTIALGLMAMVGVNAWADNTVTVTTGGASTEYETLKAAIEAGVLTSATADMTITISDDQSLGSNVVSWEKAYTLTIKATKAITIKGPNGSRWFTVKNAGANIIVGNGDYEITLDGEYSGGTTKQRTAPVALRNNTTASITFNKVKFKNFNLNNAVNMIVGENGDGVITLQDVTINNCVNPKNAYIENQRYSNDKVVLKGYLNIDENSTGTAIYAIAEKKNETTVNGRIKIDDNGFTASKLLTINWVSKDDNSVMIAGKPVVIGANATNALMFDLTDTTHGLVKHPSKGDVVITQAYTLTVSNAAAATLVLPFASTYPAAVSCYTLSHNSGDSQVTATPVETTLSANTPVLVNAAAGDYKFVSTTTDGTTATGSAPVTSGALTGVYSELAFTTENIASTYSIYILNNGTSGVGFYKAANGKKVGAYKAYLTATNVPGAAARLSIVYNDNETTGIGELKDSRIEELKSFYDLQGRRVAQPTKGLYIVNGKKVVIK